MTTNKIYVYYIIFFLIFQFSLLFFLLLRLIIKIIKVLHFSLALLQCYIISISNEEKRERKKQGQLREEEKIKFPILSKQKWAKCQFFLFEIRI